MRRYLATAAGLALLVGMAGPAAADGYTRGSIKDRPDIFRWSGWYSGAHVGYGWGSSDTSIAPGDAAAIAFVPFFAATGTPTSVSQDQRGFLSGALGGFNVQSANMVWGVESDISIGTLKGSESVPSAPGFPFTTNTVSKTDWLSTLRLRAGLLVTPQTLLYVTGGLAVGHVEHSYTLAINGAGVNFFSGSTSGTEIGWTAGAGAEFAISPRMTLRGEYLYYDLGDTKFAAPGLPGVGNFNVTAENTGHIARAALAYKF